MAKRQSRQPARKPGKKNRAVKLSPQDQQALEAATAFCQSGQFDRAEALLAPLLSREGNHPLANYLMGMIAGQQVSPSVAPVEWFAKASQLSPANPGFAFALADTLARLQRFEEAATAFRRVIRLDASSTDAYAALALMLHRLERYREAVPLFQEAIQREPGVCRHYLNAAANSIALNDATQALHLLDQGRNRIAAASLADLADMGRMYLRRYQPEAAQQVFREALQRAPKDWQIMESLARSLAATHDIEACVAMFHQAATLRGLPVEAQAYQIGLALGLAGLIEEAEAYFDAVEASAPESFDKRSDLLFFRNYLPSITPNALYETHRSVGECLAGEQDATHKDARQAERPLKIGYVSADFRKHSVAYFIGPVLQRHDKKQFRVYGYSNTPLTDVITERLKQSCHTWRDIHGMDDDAVYAQIRSDDIDILVDLSGHTEGHRLKLFARRPCPIQITWLGYPNTTGLRQMDFRITDAIADPVGEADLRHTEKLLRLPGVFSVYQPPTDAPSVAEPPILKNGFVTFGSFNNANKLNSKVLSLWAELLESIPASRLILKAAAYQNKAMRQKTRNIFAQHGVDASRLTLLGRAVDTQDHLARYADVDIALDTFPYCGTTTTCEALWMGVPVITLAGDDHRSRVGASQLTALGMTDCIAETGSAYLQIAKRLAEDASALAQQRMQLRERFHKSPLMDYSGFTRALEAAYRGAWRDWCTVHREHAP